jgi:hypothetical protein
MAKKQKFDGPSNPAKKQRADLLSSNPGVFNANEKVNMAVNDIGKSMKVSGMSGSIKSTPFKRAK